MRWWRKGKKKKKKIIIIWLPRHTHTHYFVEWYALENSLGKKIANYKFEEKRFVFSSSSKYLMVYYLSHSHVLVIWVQSVEYLVWTGEKYSYVFTYLSNKQHSTTNYMSTNKHRMKRRRYLSIWWWIL